MKWPAALATFAILLPTFLLTGCSGDPSVKTAQVAGTLDEANRQYSLGKLDQGRVWLERAVALLPDDPDTYFGADDNSTAGAVDVARGHGDFPEIVKLLTASNIKKSLAAKSDMVDESLGDAYFHLGKTAESQAAYRDEVAWLAASMSKAGATFTTRSKQPITFVRGNAEWNSGDHVAGRTDLLAVRAADKDFGPDAENALAYSEALAKENLPEAERLARGVVAEAEKSDNDLVTAAYRDTLGWVLHQEGRDADALPYLQLAAGDIPQEADVLYHLAVVYEAVGQKANASIEYDRVVTLQPFNTDAKAGLARVGPPKPTA